MNLGRLEVAAGQLDGATDLFAEASGIFRASGDRPAMIGAITRLGELEVAMAQRSTQHPARPGRRVVPSPDGARRGGASCADRGRGILSRTDTSLGDGNGQVTHRDANHQGRTQHGPGHGEPGRGRISSGGADRAALGPGAAGDAVRLLESAADSLRTIGHRAHLGLALSALAEAYATVGGHDLAAGTAREAMELLACAPGEPGREQALRRLADLADHSPPPS
jgi:hypothetical protein